MASFPATELTSARYTGTVKDENGVAVAGSVITLAKLTLYDVITGTILNSRDAQPVLNLNNVTIDESGTLVWLMQPADNAIVTDDQATEVHKAVFDVRCGVAKRLLHEVTITVTNVGHLTA